MEPLIGTACLLSSLWFLFGMPVLFAVFALKYYRSRKVPTGLLVVVVMLVAFYVSAALFWKLSAASYWDRPFLAALGQFEGNYDHEIEHLAEIVLSVVVIVATTSAVMAGLATVAVHRILLRRQRVTA